MLFASCGSSSFEVRGWTWCFSRRRTSSRVVVIKKLCIFSALVCSRAITLLFTPGVLAFGVLALEFLHRMNVSESAGQVDACESVERVLFAYVIAEKWGNLSWRNSCFLDCEGELMHSGLRTEGGKLYLCWNWFRIFSSFGLCTMAGLLGMSCGVLLGVVLLEFHWNFQANSGIFATSCSNLGGEIQRNKTFAACFPKYSLYYGIDPYSLFFPSGNGITTFAA